MDEIRGQRVYSKYTAEVTQGVEGSSWTSMRHSRTVNVKESVQIPNVRGEQIRVRRLLCDDFPFCL